MQSAVKLFSALAHMHVFIFVFYYARKTYQHKKKNNNNTSLTTMMKYQMAWVCRMPGEAQTTS